MNINDITITELETITAFDITTGAFKFTLDELQNFEINQSQETSEITGKQGRKLANLKRNKAVTISGANGLVSGGLLEMQTGSEFESGNYEVLWTDYLTVSSNTATTTYTAIGTTGAEILGLYVRNTDGTLGTTFEQDSTVATGKFTYSAKTLTFYDGDIADNTEIVVKYKRKLTANSLTNYSDVYSEKCALYVDAIAEDVCANVYRIQFYFPKADFSGEFSLTMGDDQTVHNFEAESLAGSCGAGGALWTYTIFGASAEDVA